MKKDLLLRVLAVCLVSGLCTGTGTEGTCQTSVSGTLSYFNTSGTPLDGVWIFLTEPGGARLDSVQTDQSGGYRFRNVPDGSYYIIPACTKVWGGAQSIDALMCLQYFAGMISLPPVKLKAADVNASNNVNSMDALAIARRFVGVISSFAAGDWAFLKDPVVVSGGQAAVYNMLGLCYGDVNGSFVPAPCTPWPSDAEAGPDQLNAAGNTVTMNASVPLAFETGTWKNITGTVGSFTDVHDPATLFTGVAGNSYQLTWSVSTGCYTLCDTVRVSFRTVQAVCDTFFTDPRDGQVYSTIQIGLQCWMHQNLNIGLVIPSDVMQQDNGIIEKYCFGNDTANCAVYGGLYQWDEAMQYALPRSTKGICPDGYHLPTDAEWELLANYLGGVGVAGGKMKEAGTAHWFDPNEGGSNTSGFTALPGGYRYLDGFTYDLGYYAYFWSSTPYDIGYGWYRLLGYYFESIGQNIAGTEHGFSVRCVQDCPPLGPVSAGTDSLGILGYSVALDGSLPGPGEAGTWSDLSGGGWFTDINDPLTVFTGYPGATYLLAWTVANACTAASDTVMISFCPDVSPAWAGFDQFDIMDTLINLSANYGIGEETGFWNIVSGTGGSFSDGSDPYSLFWGEAGTIYTLTWTITNGCNSASDTVLVGFCPLVTNANAGPDQLEVQQNAVTLAANTPASNESGDWSVVNGTFGIFGNSADPASSFSGQPGQHYTLVWTLTNNCGYTSSDTVLVSFYLLIVPCDPVVTDPRDGRTYHTVMIDSMCWMRENLNHGIMINDSLQQTANGYFEKYCQGNDTSCCETYGGLYQWNEMMNYTNIPGTMGICPPGWHIPSKMEWCQLAHYLDSTVTCFSWSVFSTPAGGKLKETGLDHWLPPNAGATNESGFTALGAGYHDYYGWGNNIHFAALRHDTYIWSSTETYPAYWGYIITLTYSSSDIEQLYREKGDALSVRCLKNYAEPLK